MKISRYLLSKKEKKKLIDELSSIYDYDFIIGEGKNIKKIKIEKIILDNGKIDLILIDSFPSFFRYTDRYYPTLHYIAKIINDRGLDYIKNTLRYVVVDEGALKPLLRGADVMKPGIKETNGFKKGDIVTVFLIDKWIPIVVGTALIDYSDKITKGKAIRNVHRIGDKIWDLSEKLLKDK